jgi:hypothetical protein
MSLLLLDSLRDTKMHTVATTRVLSRVTYLRIECAAPRPCCHKQVGDQWARAV